MAWPGCARGMAAEHPIDLAYVDADKQGRQWPTRCPAAADVHGRLDAV